MSDKAAEILAQLLPAEQEIKTKKEPLPTDPNHWTPAVLLERAAYLKEVARNGKGSAGETLRAFPRHTAMLSVRNRDGEAEIHTRFADLFIILEGKGTMVTGGTIVDAKETKPGEIRGSRIEGGTPHEMRQGSIMHIPAGLPHWIQVPSDSTFSAVVLKIEETDAEAM